MISTTVSRLPRMLSWGIPLIAPRRIAFHAPIFPLGAKNLATRNFGNWPMDATHDSHPVRHEETVLKFDRAERYIFKWKDCVGEEVKIKKLLNEIRKTSDVFDLVVRSDWDDSSMSVVFDASRLKEASVILQNRTQRPKECKIAGIILSRKGMTQKLVELMTSTSYVSFELIRRQ